MELRNKIQNIRRCDDADFGTAKFNNKRRNVCADYIAFRRAGRANNLAIENDSKANASAVKFQQTVLF